MVIAFRGWRSWTSQRDFSSFFSMQNHYERYSELHLWYTSTWIFSFKILTTSSYIPGGMGMLCSTHGICSMVGMTTRLKKSFQKFPHSDTSHTMASSWDLIIKRTNFSSSGYRKLDALMFIFSLHSCVNFSDGMKSGRWVGRTGRESRRSEGILLTMQYSSGRVIRTGRIWFATFL